MAGTTTNFAIPYPSSTDYVTDGATAMRSIADQVDAAITVGTPSRNLLINSAMRIAQRATSAPNSGSGLIYAVCDRWFYDNQIGRVDYAMSQETDAPVGFANSLKVVVNSSAYAFPESKFTIGQKIEANNCAGIAKGTASAKPLTLSFYVKSNKIGIYAIQILDEINNRSFSSKYTIVVAGVWELKTVQILADTTGTIPMSNGVSLRLNFYLRAGTNYTTGTSNTWATTSNVNTAAGQVVDVSTAGDYWQITGTQLTIGSVLSTGLFPFKSFADDLRDCQRYYLSQSSLGVTGTKSGSDNYRLTHITYPVTMRSTPTSTSVTSSAGSPYTESPSAHNCKVAVNIGNTTSEVNFTSFTASAEL